MKFFNLADKKLKDKILIVITIAIIPLVVIAIMPLFTLNPAINHTRVLRDQAMPMIYLSGEIKKEICLLDDYSRLFMHTHIPEYGGKIYGHRDNVIRLIRKLDSLNNHSNQHINTILDSLRDNYKVINTVINSNDIYFWGEVFPPMTSLKNRAHVLIDRIEKSNIAIGEQKKDFLHIFREMDNNDYYVDRPEMHNKFQTQLEKYSRQIRPLLVDSLAVELDTMVFRSQLYFQRNDTMQQNFKKIISYCDECIVLSNKLSGYIDKRAELSAKDSLVGIYQTINYLIIGILVAILICAFFIRKIRKGISKDVKGCLVKADALANGNLQMNILHSNNKDEFAQLNNALAKTFENVRNMIGRINDTMTELENSSQNINQTSNQISDFANEQASNSVEISSQIEQMTSGILANSQNASQTEEYANQTSKDLMSIDQATKQTVDSMKKIKNKIKIIDDIAFQTNILALNAAVEAARAGEHGKGFAVVAAEVRKLAERSSVAAKEIDQVSKDGVNSAQNTAEIFEKILPNIQNTINLVQEIALACNEQVSQSEQINQNVHQFSNVSNHFASMGNQLLNASMHLSQIAQTLQEMIKVFKM